MKTGTVNWFNDSRGYGFITPDDGGVEVFAHYTAIKTDGFKTLAEGQRVSFEQSSTARGPTAIQIQKVLS